MILGVCAFVSLIVGIATEGWLKGSHDGLGIVATTILVVLLHSLHCHDLDDENKMISVQVSRNEF